MASELRATTATVDLGAIRHNAEVFRRVVSEDAAVMAVVKANGYGHGAVDCARAALAGGATWLGVATVEEGVELRDAGLTVPILVLGASNQRQTERAAEAHIDVTVTDRTDWEWAAEAGERSGTMARVHLKVDTGMGRLGVRPDAVASEWLPRLTTGRTVWQGLMSHLADSDAPSPERTRGQLSVFLDVIEAIRQAGAALPPMLHLANSAAALRFPGTHFTMVRVGIGLYGGLDVPEAAALRPAMMVESAVTLVKRVPSGSLIGYGGTFEAPRECTIATVPMGYADGYRRALSNRAEVLIRGHRCPVVGRVSMDQITVMVPDELVVQIGDPVVLLGSSGSEQVTVHELASWADTISYEILTGISARVPRRLIPAQLP